MKSLEQQRAIMRVARIAMNHSSQVFFAGALTSVTLEAKREWYYVEFPCGMTVKVSPFHKSGGNEVWRNTDAIAQEAAHWIENLPIKQSRRVLQWALRPGAGRDNVDWACKKLGVVSRDEKGWIPLGVIRANPVVKRYLTTQEDEQRREREKKQ